MGIDILILIILSICLLLTVDRFNSKLPMNIKNIVGHQYFLYAICAGVLGLAYLNIQYLVYFSILFIMVKVCFSEKKAYENFGIPTSTNVKDYHETVTCRKLSRSTKDAEDAVKLYDNDYFGK